MPDTMIEIDIEDLFAGSMSFEKPVLRSAVTGGVLLDISDDVLAIESFTASGIVMPLVYGVGVLAEIDIEELFVVPGMSYEKPVLWRPVGAGYSKEIPMGAKAPWPGDTMTIIDFEDDVGVDINIGISQGSIFVGINSRKGIILGSLADGVSGFSGLGLIDFVVGNQHIDRMA
jgi:hypothetical protein